MISLLVKIRRFRVRLLVSGLLILAIFLIIGLSPEFWITVLSLIIQLLLNDISYSEERQQIKTDTARQTIQRLADDDPQNDLPEELEGEIPEEILERATRKAKKLDPSRNLDWLLDQGIIDERQYRYLRVPIDEKRKRS